MLFLDNPQLRSRRQTPPAALMVQTLEPRRLLSTTTPATALTLADRKALLADWNGSDVRTLKHDLDVKNVNQFDSDLLHFITSEPGARGKFFFSPASATVNSYISFIQANSTLDTSDATSIAGDVLNHVFPDGNGVYDVQLPAGNVNWLKITATSGTENLDEMNRQDFFQDLAMTYRLTGNASYLTELMNEMASWSAQNPLVSNPNSESTAYLLDTSQRVENWLWAYELVLSSPSWTPAANTLFLYEMDLQAQYLNAATPYQIADNVTVQQARSLLSIGQLFPDFTNSAKWAADGRSLMFQSMDSQIYADGSDLEQSPGYAAEILLDLMEQQQQDAHNGYSWPTLQLDRLKKGFKAFEQQLTPDGNRSAQGDSERAQEEPLLSEAALAHIESFPEAKPRLLDVWLFGPSKVGPIMGNPLYPALPDRGLTYELPDSGNYIMRSTDDSSNGLQVTFNDGPQGGTHGHPDYLNFELYGFGKALIADTGPWAYDNSPQRAWAMATPSNNTISVDNTSADDLEGVNNPNIVLDQWDVQSDFVQVTAHYVGNSSLSGDPVLARSIWYNYSGTMLVVDWTWCPDVHQYTVSFNLDDSATTNSDKSIQTNDSSGNVKISPLLLPGQTAAATTSATYDNSTFNTFADFSLSEQPGSAVRYTVSQKTGNAVFAELITAYGGTSAPDVTANFAATPVPGKPVKIDLTQNGVTQTITFTPPTHV